MQISFKLKLRKTACILLLTILPICHQLIAQSKRLEIQKKDSYEIRSDTVVLDELIMHDSSTLILNRTSATTFIKVNRLKIGIQCSIVGSGIHGSSAIPAVAAHISDGTCKHGMPGPNGKNGTNGEAGKNLTLEVSVLEYDTSPLMLQLNGGYGGDGGSGGDGGDGSKSTAHCNCDGGNGGNGGKGGDGAAGGTFIFRCAQCPPNLISGQVIRFNLLGGYGGYGGEGGRGGTTGEGASRSSKRGADGKHGERGKKGAEGKFLYSKLEI